MKETIFLQKKIKNFIFILFYFSHGEQLTRLFIFKTVIEKYVLDK